MLKAIGATVIALAIAAGTYIAGAHAGADRAARESQVTHSIIDVAGLGNACRRTGG
jgi:hypothetical protein